MTIIETTPKTGQFAGQTVFTNRDGAGIFTRRQDGTHQQHAGTGQTPRFTTSQQLAVWLRRNYPSF